MALKVIVAWFGAIGAMTVALILNDPLVIYSGLWRDAPITPNVVSLCLLAISVWLMSFGFGSSLFELKAVRLVTAIGAVVCVALVVLLNVSNLLVLNAAEKLGRASIIVDGDIAYLSGNIDRTLPGRVKLLIKSERIRLVMIDSLGGLAGAARTIADELNSNYIVVRAARECASACLVLWANAAQREAYPGSRFGVHRGNMGDGQSRGLVRKVLIDVVDRSLVGDLVRIGFSPSVVNSAIQKPTEVVTWIQGVELEQMGVNLRIVR